ncbi:MAG: MerR family transcriptional regulator [Velocimicrobium sp.]
MRFSISETAKLAGVSVRTLHYYDEIGLLKPSEIVLDTGYRYYDKLAMEKLQQILFYRELDFSLKEIMKIMNASDYKKEDALKRQRELLKLKRKRLDKLISLLDANLKGDNTMNFDEFDSSELEQAKEKYAKEVESKWGSTDAYKQSEEKTAKYKKEDWAVIMKQSDEILKLFSNHLGENPKVEEVQNLVSRWQQFITDSYYDCTKEILAGLGQMYVADERFTANMDKFGVGTAQLMSEAIKEYCKN